MKRLDPKTGMTFKQGDIRKDGYIFNHYRLTRKPKKDGYFEELWFSPKVFKNRKEYNKKYLGAQYTTFIGRAKVLLNSAKNRAPTTITLPWIVERLEKGVCELSGLPFDLKPPKLGTQYNPNSPSLDKIDSKIKEYSPENTRLILTSVNLALNQYGLKYFLKMAQAVIDYQKEK